MSLYTIWPKKCWEIHHGGHKGINKLSAQNRMCFQSQCCSLIKSALNEHPVCAPCVIRVCLLFPEDIWTVSTAPLGLYDTLAHKHTVYVMTPAHWFTNSSHIGVGHRLFYVYSWVWEKKAHTHTLVYSRVAGLRQSRSCGCFQEECWLFHKTGQSQSQSSTTTAHTALCVSYIHL